MIAPGCRSEYSLMRSSEILAIGEVSHLRRFFSISVGEYICHASTYNNVCNSTGVNASVKFDFAVTY
jgi:hypothetical protein